jgi:hypothetical protein
MKFRVGDIVRIDLKDYEMFFDAATANRTYEVIYVLPVTHSDGTSHIHLVLRNELGDWHEDLFVLHYRPKSTFSLDYAED